MPESTLNLKLSDLQAEVGDFLGWGRGPDNGSAAWSDSKQRRIKSCVESCLRLFYFQAQPDPGGPVHKWSFLQPVTTVTLADGGRSCVLPADFGGIEGQVTIQTPGQSGFWPLHVVTAEEIRTTFARTSTAVVGRPDRVAVSPIKGTGAESSSRYQLDVYPEANQEYSLKLGYYILPDFLTTANPYPYGGAAHAETMKAGARAAAEMQLDNERGPQWEAYRMALSASIVYDRRNKARFLGYNGDMSDCHYEDWRRSRFIDTITIAGQDPS